MGDVRVLRHSGVELFLCPLAVASLAYLFKTMGATLYSGRVDWGTGAVSEALSIVSGALCAALLLLYAVRAVLFPRKCAKDWSHPVRGNYFSAVSMCLSLYGLLLFDDYLDFGLGLTWAGAGLQMALAVHRVAALVFDYSSDESVSPALLLAPTGCFLSASALASCA